MHTLAARGDLFGNGMEVWAANGTRNPAEEADIDNEEVGLERFYLVWNAEITCYWT